jgi:Zn-dependent M28 family amino/carboxypeptidase
MSRAALNLKTGLNIISMAIMRITVRPILTARIIFLQWFILCVVSSAQNRSTAMMDIEKTSQQLKNHLHQLTVGIGERSVRVPENLTKTAEYIESFYDNLGMPVRKEPYQYSGMTVVNVVSEIAFGPQPEHHFLVGAHYDSVMGTVGADDNASAVAVQLEIARQLKALASREQLNLKVKFVSFALEEPPVYHTPYMGSRVYARRARKENEKIDGMICLEMVGYACYEPGCQRYPFPLMFFGYPKQGDFIGIVANYRSRKFSKLLAQQFSKNAELPVVTLNVPLNGRILPAVRLSDHASFWDEGFNAVMITDSAFFRNPHYHTALDTMEKLDYRFMAELVESLVRFFRSFKPK